MAERIEIEFRRRADRWLPPRSRIVLAVSGGADSMALLHLTARAAPRRRWELLVAHLDHGLRSDSADDSLFVERQAAARELASRVERREVAVGPGESPEASARRVRQAFLRDVADEFRATAIATGHTRDDQAETVLMRLARGAGPTGLAAMTERGPDRRVRPLLFARRDEIRELLRRRGVAWREDSTNRDVSLERNRIRRQVLPYLAEQLNPAIADHLVGAAERIREDAACLDRLAAEAVERLLSEARDGSLALAGKELADLPTAIGRRVVARVLRRAGVDATRVAARHLEAVLDIAGGGRGRRVDLPGDRVAWKDSRGRLRVGRGV